VGGGISVIFACCGVCCLRHWVTDLDLFCVVVHNFLASLKLPVMYCSAPEFYKEAAIAGEYSALFL
jgi:hypothetical protein